MDWKLISACFSYWSPGATKFSIRMRSMVKDVTNRFDQHYELGNKIGLQVITTGASSSVALQRPLTSIHRNEPAVYGRDEDKKKILEMVLYDANFLVIPIVGMGGVEKTRLAREVFNDSEIGSFEVKAWVSYGDFVITRISKSILENISGSSSSPNDLATMRNELKKKTNGKKKSYLCWMILQPPFKAGALGSRKIVTTRL
ncbi:hypothetical protein Ddye_028415 [Dipteronia dyeriana]|uniref:NB-ARC domain-containing protein n=1 Tax=Dipteronia dyeriana TaxID=168575 RepID=A0AAD9WSB5_9ROSI|nr:hypothetical protein Ddye_028415 [Dipteronia dyeriana]